jgi:8-oxo-dGTP pyrophosphatase MutT (NUDIX family)
MNNSNPWKTKSTRLIYENPWIRVREDQVIRPDGNPGIYGVVEYHPCVGILPIDADGNVHLVGQHRYPLDVYSWEIPEGACNPDEEFEAAARRELKEELGLKARKLEKLITSHLSNSVSNEIAHIFLATELSQHEAEPEGTEQLERKIVTFAKALEMVRSGEITDSMSQIAILYYASLMKNK